MPVQNEIQNKEKALSDLMTRILQAPLVPIDNSIKTLQSSLLETQDQLEKIEETVYSLNSFAEDNANKTSRQSKKEFTKIQEDIQVLDSKLKENFAMISEDQRQALDLLISENSSQHNSLKSTSDNIIKNLSETTVAQRETLSSILNVRQEILTATEKIQENIQSLNSQLKEDFAIISEDQRQALESVILQNASQHSSSLKSTSDDIIKTLSETTITQRETLSSILSVRQELIIAIESVKNTQTLQMQATIKGIQFTKESKEKEHASLTIQIEAFNKAAAAKLDTLSTDTRCSLTEQRKIKQEISAIIEFNHSATGTLLTQQHAALQEKIITIQHKLNNQTIIIVLFLISIIIYIGFDIFSQIN